MKKLFFTAIALVAFSGVSMGNIIEVAEVENDLQPGVGTACEQEARQSLRILQVNICISTGEDLSAAVSQYFYDQFLTACNER